MMLLATTDWAQVAAILAPVLLAMIALYAEIVRRDSLRMAQLEAVKKQTDGLMDKFTTLAGDKGHAEGKSEQLEIAQEKQDVAVQVAAGIAAAKPAAPPPPAIEKIEIVNTKENPVPTTDEKKIQATAKKKK